MENKILAFCHIPKNAGSLVTYLLRSTFGADHCRAVAKNDIYNYQDLKGDLKIYPSLKTISGHPLRPYADFRELERNLIWSVLLRDPYSRFPSQYKWWCKQNNSQITFEEWCEQKGEKFGNFQCRWIGGFSDHQAALKIINSKSIVVGFQSDIEGFLQKVVNAANISTFPWDKNLVINPGSIQSTAFKKELIERYNGEDIQLYDHLISKENMRKQNADWARPFELRDKIRYYLNLAKHVAIYKPYKSFVLSHHSMNE